MLGDHQSTLSSLSQRRGDRSAEASGKTALHLMREGDSNRPTSVVA